MPRVFDRCDLDQSVKITQKGLRDPDIQNPVKSFRHGSMVLRLDILRQASSCSFDLRASSNTDNAQRHPLIQPSSLARPSCVSM